MKFATGEVYTHTGKTFYISRRTEKSVWVSSGSKVSKSTRKVIKTDRLGNEQVKIDEFRSLFAGKTDL